jgi:hypothetical protein
MGVLWILRPEVGVSVLVEILLFYLTGMFAYETGEANNLLNMIR